jgi:acyl-CoA oxidase
LRYCLCFHFVYAGQQAAALRQQHRTLLAALRPEAVALVDAFGWEDYALNSALGREDGDVYRALLDMAQVGLMMCRSALVLPKGL